MKERVTVHLWSGLRALAGGAESVQVEANTVGEMLDALAREYPGLADMLEDSVSVSIDGAIIAQSLTHPVKAENEIYLLQRIKGG